MKNQILFIEKQYFRQFLVIGLLAFVNLFFAVGFIQQNVLGHPFGTKSAPDTVLILFLIGTWVLTYFTLKANLTTTISSEGVSYQFTPFQRKPKLIAWHDMKTCYIRKYSPLKEYGVGIIETILIIVLIRLQALRVFRWCLKVAISF